MTFFIIILLISAYTIGAVYFALEYYHWNVIQIASWPLFALIWIAIWAWGPVKKGYDKAKAWNEKRKHVPTPEEIAAGTVATIMLHKPELWGNEYRGDVWTYKQVRVDRRYDHDFSLRMGDIYIKIKDEDVLKSMEKSFQLKQEMLANKARANRDRQIIEEIGKLV